MLAKFSINVKDSSDLEVNFAYLCLNYALRVLTRHNIKISQYPRITSNLLKSFEF